MPLSKLALTLVAVLAAAGLTVWLAALGAAWAHLPAVALGVAAIAGLAAYILALVLSDRLRNAEDRHYDRIER